MAVHAIAVIGAGTMGAGIAQIAATAGLDVTLIDVSDPAVGKGLEAIHARSSANGGGRQNRRGTKGRGNPLDPRNAHFEELEPVNLVIEAVTENFDLKMEVLRQIFDAFVRPEAIVASNTSSISITKFASVISRFDRFIGMHFFNPVPIMALVEIVRGLQTAMRRTRASKHWCCGWASRRSRSEGGPGFLVNRILLPMINRGVLGVLKGNSTATEIEQAMKLAPNHPMGPLALADMIGLDVLLSVMQTITRSSATRNTGPARCSRRRWPRVTSAVKPAVASTGTDVAVRTTLTTTHRN